MTKKNDSEQTQSSQLSHQTGLTIHFSTPDDGRNHVSISVLWNGGTINVQCVNAQPPHQSEQIIKEAIAKFANECHLTFILFESVLRSRNPILNHLRNMNADRNALFVVADTDETDNINQIWAQTPMGIVLDAFSQNGEFETTFAKAFVALAYQLWEDNTRHIIAQALAVKHTDVKSDLMGEWRYLRHWIVHPSTENERKYFENANMLANLPGSPQPDSPAITAKMMTGMMGLLNSLNVVVTKTSESPPITKVEPASPEVLDKIARQLRTDNPS